MEKIVVILIDQRKVTATLRGTNCPFYNEVRRHQGRGRVWENGRDRSLLYPYYLKERKCMSSKIVQWVNSVSLEFDRSALESRAVGPATLNRTLAGRHPGRPPGKGLPASTAAPPLAGEEARDRQADPKFETPPPSRFCACASSSRVLLTDLAAGWWQFILTGASLWARELFLSTTLEPERKRQGLDWMRAIDQ